MGEILIFNLAETNYYNLTAEFKNLLHTPLLPTVIVLSGVAGLILSWPLARYCSMVFRMPITLLKTFLLSIVLGSLFYLGIENNMLWYYILILIFFIPIGYLLRKNDVIPLIFSFIFAKISITIFERIII
jgi:hypothetical protein